MLRLAAKLQSITRSRTTADGRQLELWAGIDCGPVAGAVIGAHRAFYCLYGDVMNTAARMCKYAPGGTLGATAHCTAAFKAALAASGPGVQCLSRGLRKIKGKGEIETFDALLVSSDGFGGGCCYCGGVEGICSCSAEMNVTIMSEASPPSMLTVAPGPRKFLTQVLGFARRLWQLFTWSGIWEPTDQTKISIAQRAPAERENFWLEDRPEYREGLTHGLGLHVAAVLVQV